MKVQFYQFILLSLVISTTLSCGSLKVTNMSTNDLNTFPECFDNQYSLNNEEFKSITINNYFNDKLLLKLFNDLKNSNLDYQILEQRVLIANAHLKQAKLAMLPSLDFLINASGTRYGDYTIDGVGNFDTNLSGNINDKQKVRTDITPNYFVGLNTSWEIDIWGRLKNQKKAAKERYLASHEGRKLLLTQIFTDAADLYYQLVALDKKLKIYQENYLIQYKAFEIISSQRDIGKATELAVQQFNAQNKNLLVEIEVTNIEITAIEKALLSMLGKFEGEIVRSNDFLTNHIELLNQKMDVDSVIHHRPDVAESYFELQATNADARSARAAFFPKLQLGGSFGLNSFSIATFFNPGSIAWQLLGGLTSPIFNQGQIKRDFYISKRNQEIAFFNYQKNVVNAFNEISFLLSKVGAYQQILALKDDEVVLLERAVDVSSDLYLAGNANYLEIINSQKLKLQAELNYVDYQYQNSHNLILLFKALGGEMK
ncbi:MAG: TolC family protein [Crocinitomicaceae bacterium]|nr:TolC family protein [Crocinitomicaceae bacterium]